MVERTVYVGSNLQVMVRLATGVQLQASITNTGQAAGMDQGTPVAVQIPADALRVLRDDGGEYTRERARTSDRRHLARLPTIRRASAAAAAARPVRTAPSM